MFAEKEKIMHTDIIIRESFFAVECILYLFNMNLLGMHILSSVMKKRSRSSESWTGFFLDFMPNVWSNSACSRIETRDPFAGATSKTCSATV